MTEADEIKNPEKLEYRTVVIRNLNEDVKDEALLELFPDAPPIFIVRDSEEKCRG